MNTSPIFLFKFIFYDGYIVKKTTCLTLNHLKHNIQYITNLIDKKERSTWDELPAVLEKVVLPTDALTTVGRSNL